MDKDKKRTQQCLPDENIELLKIVTNFNETASDFRKVIAQPDIINRLNQITGLTKNELLMLMCKNCSVCGDKYTSFRYNDLGICHDCIDISNYIHEAGHAVYAIASGIRVNYLACKNERNECAANKNSIIELYLTNNNQPQINSTLAGLIAQSIFLGLDWFLIDKFLDQYLPKFNSPFSKEKLFNLLYESFSDIISRLLVTSISDILDYVTLTYLNKNVRFEDVLLGKEIDRNLIKHIKSDIVEIKKVLFQKPNIYRIHTISNELYEKEYLEEDQIMKLMDANN